MKITNCSNEINIEFVANFELVSKVDKDKVQGYKLVRKEGDNYYSIISGFFRYKLGWISKKNSYNNLYVGKESYRDFMVGKTTIFKNLDDVFRYYPCLSEEKKLVIIQMELGGDLIDVKCDKDGELFSIFAGNNILKIEEVDEKDNKKR